MGGGASIEKDMSVAEKSEALLAATKELTSMTWDRVLIRLHDGSINDENTLNTAVHFEITSGDGSAIGHELLDEKTSPLFWKSKFAQNKLNPVWHDNQTLLFRRSPNATYHNSDDAPIHQLNIKVVGKSTGFIAEVGGMFGANDLDILMNETIRLPSPNAMSDSGSQWIPYEIAAGKCKKLRFDLQVRLCEDAICTAAEITAFTDRMTVTKFEGLSNDGNAVMRHVKKEGNLKSLLWFPGRNDSFHNPLFGRQLLDAGFDLYVIDPRLCGACRKYFPNTFAPEDVHSIADFKEYFEEIDLALDFIEAQGYREKPVGYCHSTGGLVLTTYLLHRGDFRFSSFLFNSPFFDWGHVGGDFNEFVLEYGISTLADLGLVDGKSGFTKGGSLINLSTWHHRVWSAHQFDLETQAVYQTDLTFEFIAAVTRQQAELLSFLKKTPLTQKPILVMTGCHDKCLVSTEIDDISRKIGPNITFVEMQWVDHDILASSTKEKCQEGITIAINWLQNKDA